MCRIATFLCLFTSVFSLTCAGEETRILFIGNSYTGQIRNAITGLIKASPKGDDTEFEFITPGGKTLQFHLETEATTQRIKDGDWDFVVLQDQSQTPAVFPKKFEDAARDLDKLIDAAGAKTVFYQTWGRRDGDKMNPKLFPDYESMQEKLSKSYGDSARRCEAVLAPVGDTWARVRKADPTLGTALYKDDGSHPSEKGAYLAACVFYVTLFGESPAGIDYRGGLSEDEAEVILKELDLPKEGAQPSPYPVARTLTNANGQQIEVQITGRSKTQIHFRSRGKSHIYDISQVSEADQDFIGSLPVTK
jgi:hypothetical protein